MPSLLLVLVDRAVIAPRDFFLELDNGRGQLGVLLILGDSLGRRCTRVSSSLLYAQRPVPVTHANGDDPSLQIASLLCLLLPCRHVDLIHRVREELLAVCYGLVCLPPQLCHVVGGHPFNSIGLVRNVNEDVLLLPAHLHLLGFEHGVLLKHRLLAIPLLVRLPFEVGSEHLVYKASGLLRLSGEELRWHAVIVICFALSTVFAADKQALQALLLDCVD